MTDTHPAIDRLVEDAGDLYSLPTVAVEVLRLTNDPRVDVARLKQVIENDPALTSRLLRVVNSSLFGLSRQVSNLSQALALLGTKPLKLLVLGFSLPRGMYHGVESAALGRYWHHALVKAVAAREIADAMAPKLTDEAFLIGLLQDLGMLVLIQQLGEPYSQFVAQVDAQGGDLLDWEQESLGFDHTELSATLLERWGLPSLLVESVYAAESETPASESVVTLRRAVALAEEIAVLLAENRATALDRFLRRMRAEHAHIPFYLEAAVLRIETTVGQLADVFSLELPDRRDYRDLLLEAHRRLSAVAADAAGELASQDRAKAADVAPLETHELAQAFDRVTRARRAASSQGALAVAEPATALRFHEAESQRPAPQRLVHQAPTSDAALVGRLSSIMATCRKDRASLSLLLAEVDHFDDLVFHCGAEEAQRLRDRVGRFCQWLDCAGAVTLPVGEARFAAILPNCDRIRAARLGHGLIDSVSLTRASGPERPQLEVSVGVASLSVPPKNFPVEELVARADRCLFAAQASGGGTIKSIELC